ncbi:glycerate kinase [Bacillus shivajii]|uniref:glycerate kinase n=1 Tax=Bacillus shivajii TaxID=1983719 RepID=UPI001CFBCD39|nr:glycerate kinase [Bacillus shivajii]UCZ52832.1 glycerate kinase [Bacillus shivajii]
MNIFIAPDSFKGSMSSIEAANAIHKGIERSSVSANIQTLPMADGGEGTVDALIHALDCEKVVEKSIDPLGRQIECYYAWNEKRKLAIIETAAASGITLLEEGELNPFKASTHGTGDLVKSALNKGAKEIVIGLGGSATVDGGTGFLQELGVKFLDENDNAVERVNGELSRIHEVDISGMDERLCEVKVTIASDVENPLLGSNGAVAVFGPQKGVEPDQLDLFERGMKKFADCTVQAMHKDYREHAGAGAAGGFGFALLSYLNAEMQNGFDLVAELTSMEEKIEWADLVISGEGKLDEQTFFGKGPMGVVRLAEEKNKRVILFAGSISKGFVEKEKELSHLVAFPIIHELISLEGAMERGPELLEEVVYKVMKVCR